jgi:hypothetical protein
MAGSPALKPLPEYAAGKATAGTPGGADAPAQQPAQ